MTGCRRTWPPKSGGQIIGDNCRVSSWGTAPTTPAHSRSTGGGTQVLDRLALANGINNSGEVVGSTCWTTSRTPPYGRRVAPFSCRRPMHTDGDRRSVTTGPLWAAIRNPVAPAWSTSGPVARREVLDLQPTGTCSGQAFDIDDADTSVRYHQSTRRPAMASGPRPRSRHAVRQVHESDAPDRPGLRLSQCDQPVGHRSSGRPWLLARALAWIYSHGSLTVRLQDLMPPDTPWTLQERPEGINNRGQIIGWAVREHRRRCAPGAIVRLIRGTRSRRARIGGGPRKIPGTALTALRRRLRPSLMYGSTLAEEMPTVDWDAYQPVAAMMGAFSGFPAIDPSFTASPYEYTDRFAQ